jgi:heme/copper-type cytochrome/quinol oxidase subunit 3
VSVTTVPEARPMQTGWSNGKLGVILFLASETMLFGSILANYLYNRAWTRSWPPEGDIAQQVGRAAPFPLAFILTVLLLASGFTCHRALAAIRRGDQYAMLGWLTATLWLGAGFVLGQSVEYTVMLQRGIAPWSGLYGTAYYSLTGLHGLHLIAGLGLLAGVYFRGLSGHFTWDRHFAVEGVTTYWYFVNLVWIVLFALLYKF